jgi:cation diffusion facilitator family transporter
LKEKVENTAIKTTLFSISASVVLVVVKLIAGILGNSFALIADGIESVSDVISSVFLFFGLTYAAKPPDENHPYGHGKIEPLVTFVVVAFLLASAVFIAFQSILNINTPHELPEFWTLYVLTFIVAWKEVSYRIVLKRAEQTKSSALAADAWHHRSDAITSVAASIGISLALWLGEGYENLDDWAALFASCFIVYNAYLIFKPAWSEIMDEHIYPELEVSIRRIAEKTHHVMNTEKCFIRKAGFVYHIELHIRVDGTITVAQGHNIAHHVKDALKNELTELGNVVIHVEPN